MDSWSSYDAGSAYSRESAYRSRVLASTSGNAQSFGRGTKVHLDFRKPGISGGRPLSDSHPSSLPILGSNDGLTQDRLAARKARRAGHATRDRPYLQNPKYLSYRARKRQDKGSDGKPVWPDHIEDSFQNVQIPPMGRKKKTQYGRPHGRNELIAEWIYQDTGEIRDRKQVSSHIQVLSGFLKDVPEWRALTDLDDDNEDCKEEAGCDYYYESIADQVRLQRQLAKASETSYGEETWPSPTSQRHHLSRLTFELWVGAPDNITQALHNYTRVPNSHSPLPSVPLEDFGNWRELFPNLEATLDSVNDGQLEVILVKSSFALMSDFPPKASKLGLVLDLDFRDPGQGNIKALSDLKYWSSVNHMYLNGRPFRKTEHKECQSAEFGLVKPFFEADWWASHFTKLTHKRKEAENRTDDLAQIAADEYSRSLFRGLSIMQEVFASPCSEQGSGLPRRKMAILLWIFSQVGKGQAGVTSWQKLILPPSRIATNSPFAPSDMMDASLLPLVLDSLVESSLDTAMPDHDFSLHGTEATIPISPVVYEPGSYHSGFTPLQTMDNDHLRFYDYTGTEFTPRLDGFLDGKCNSFDFNAPLLSPPSFGQAPDNLGSQDHVNNGFDDLPIEETHQDLSAIQVLDSRDEAAVDLPERRQCLANFDMSTHKMLQAQLSKDEVQFTIPPTEDYDLLEPESRQLVIGYLDGLRVEGDDPTQSLMNISAVTHTSPSHVDDNQPSVLLHSSTFQSPTSSRPRLRAHNSFTGVLHSVSVSTDTHDEQLGFETLSRNEFARLMATQFDSASKDESLKTGVAAEIELRSFTTDNDIIRPRSQPVLPSNASPLRPQEDSLILGTPVSRRHFGSSITMKK